MTRTPLALAVLVVGGLTAILLADPAAIDRAMYGGSFARNMVSDETYDSQCTCRPHGPPPPPQFGSVNPVGVAGVLLVRAAQSWSRIPVQDRQVSPYPEHVLPSA